MSAATLRSSWASGRQTWATLKPFLALHFLLAQTVTKKELAVITLPPCELRAMQTIHKVSTEVLHTACSTTQVNYLITVCLARV